jgi:NAD(P)-dependent dehydrogenase (short-subunit alcohol dehydrogenase family)
MSVQYLRIPDLKKRTWLITGGNSGLGYQCARFLSQQHPDDVIVITSRDGRRGQAAAANLRKSGAQIEVLPLDLANLANVRAFPATFRQKRLPPLAGIVCNAGGQSVGAPERTVDGYEVTFQSNHLGHYLLTRLMLHDVQTEGRIVFVSSNTHDPLTKTGMPEPRFQNPTAIANDLEPGADAGRRRYTTSKLCNIYNAYELAERLAASADERLRSIRVNAFDPGMMPGTGLARNHPAPLRFVWRYVLPVLTLFQRNVNRPSTSGRRLSRLADGNMGDATGKYISEGRETRSSALSYDKNNALRLWNASADMVGLPQEL